MARNIRSFERRSQPRFYAYNIVLFSLKDADPINFQLYEAKSVAYTIEPTDNPFS